MGHIAGFCPLRPTDRFAGTLKVQARIADTTMMDIFAHAHVGSGAPRWAHDEPAGAIFAGRTVTIRP